MLNYQRTTCSFGFKTPMGWEICYPDGLVPPIGNMFHANGSKWLQLIVTITNYLFSVTHYETDIDDDDTNEFTYSFCIVVLGFYIHLTEHYLYVEDVYDLSINSKLFDLKASIRSKQKALSDAQWALINFNVKVEQKLKDKGITPITLYANTMWPSDRLYVLTQEAQDFINMYDYTNPGVAYDMLFCVANHHKSDEMFVVIELTSEYVEYLEDVELLQSSGSISDPNIVKWIS